MVDYRPFCSQEDICYIFFYVGHLAMVIRQNSCPTSKLAFMFISGNSAKLKCQKRAHFSLVSNYMSQDSTKNRIRLGSDDRDVKRGLIARNFFERKSLCQPLKITLIVYCL